MPNTLDVSAHALLWHNTEAVTFHKIGFASGVATDTETAITRALRRSLNQNDLRSLELEATAVATVWHIPVSQLATEPVHGDWIEATDANWTVITADKQTFGTRWRCVCVRQVS